MVKVSVLITPRSFNTKTGDIPQVWIGSTHDEARASCDKAKCPMRPWAKEGAMSCYAWTGTSRMAFYSASKHNVADPDFDEVLRKSSRQAQAIRVGALGDPCAMPLTWWNKLKAAAGRFNMTILSYTHGWRDHPKLAGRTMASCDSVEQVLEAKAMGFQAAWATRDVGDLDKFVTLPDGSRATVCPAIYAKAAGKAPVTCNQCRKCDGTNPNLTIIFPDHGPSARRKQP